MPDLFADIQAFHQKFGHDSPDKPIELDDDTYDFRVKFMTEELTEYQDAWNQADMEGQLDALVDLVYVVLGTAYMQGFNFYEAWRRVHEANMKKVRAQNADESKRGSTLDVVKPEDWLPADLSDLV